MLTSALAPAQTLGAGFLKLNRVTFSVTLKIPVTMQLPPSRTHRICRTEPVADFFLAGSWCPFQFFSKDRAAAFEEMPEEDWRADCKLRDKRLPLRCFSQRTSSISVTVSTPSQPLITFLFTLGWNDPAL
jgi:hypothetical protein